MRRVKFKIAFSFITFTIGIVCAFLWCIYPLSSNQISENLSPDTVLTDEAEEYAVYSAVINKRYVKSDSTNLLVISDQTSFYGNRSQTAIYSDNYIENTTSEQRVHQMKKSYPSVSEETLFDYDEKKLQSSKIGYGFDLLVGYKLINENELEKDNTNKMIRLSKVGFNSEKTEAFVYVEFICPALCGEGNKLLLEKVDGVWKIKENFGGWRS